MLLHKPDRERGFKKERIIRVLLNHSSSASNKLNKITRPESASDTGSKQGEEGNNQLSKYKVAQLADVSQPWCLEYIDRLEAEELVDCTKVIKPKQLYEKWRQIRIRPNQTSLSLQDPLQLLVELRERGLNYALTSYQAETIIQGFLFPSRTDFYIDPEQVEDWEQVVQEWGLVGGGNTRIKITDRHVFYNKVTYEQQVVVSIPQIIVDLLEEGGPCLEAADKLIASYHSSKP